MRSVCLEVQAQSRPAALPRPSGLGSPAADGVLGGENRQPKGQMPRRPGPRCSPPHRPWRSLNLAAGFSCSVSGLSVSSCSPSGSCSEKSS